MRIGACMPMTVVDSFLVVAFPLAMDSSLVVAVFRTVAIGREVPAGRVLRSDNLCFDARVST